MLSSAPGYIGDAKRFRAIGRFEYGAVGLVLSSIRRVSKLTETQITGELRCPVYRRGVGVAGAFFGNTECRFEMEPCLFEYVALTK
jgi:hypothetical protein